MKRFTWSEQLATGFADIDEQHRRLIDILDRLASRCADGGVMAPAELETVVADLADYAREHFDAEVQLMLDSRCDLRHVQMHVREHENFIRHISLVREALEESRDDEGSELARYLGEWFARHIVGSDLSMARQIQYIRAGQTPDAAYAAEHPAAA